MKNIMENTNVNIQNNNLIKIFKGIIISFILTLMLLFIFAIALTYTNIQEKTIAPIIIIITAISILIGSSISTIKIKKNGILNGGIIGLIYISIIYIISSLVQTGFTLNTTSILMIMFSILAGMVGGIVGVNIH